MGALNPSRHFLGQLPLQISLNTRDIFIECTATDLTKARVVLNTLVCMFAEYCDRPFEVEPVEVVGADGQTTGKAGSGALYGVSGCG